MRSPVIAFSLIAAAAVSPSLVSGAPTSPQLENALSQTEAVANPHQIRSLPEPVNTVFKAVSGGAPKTAAVEPEVKDDFDEDAEPSKRTAALRQANAPPGTQPQTNSAQPPMPPMQKRADNSDTAGGNSFTGGAGNTSGGGVSNYADDGSIQNKPGPAGGLGGDGGRSYTGFAWGGDGKGLGPGGNANTGEAGKSNGGSVWNEADGDGYDRHGRGRHGEHRHHDPNGDVAVFNEQGSNHAGNGGYSESGTAVGGSAGRARYGGPSPPNQKRSPADDSETAGGSAYSGSTSDVNGGYIVNDSERGRIVNGKPPPSSSKRSLMARDDPPPMTNVAGHGGKTVSGDAIGGSGYNLGPGGNAYTGMTGNATGGGVYNHAGTIDNYDHTNVGGKGGFSSSGDARGGSA